MHKIVKIHVMQLHESCERDTFYVVATTDEGFTMEVAGHSTGSIYTEGKGLSIEEARDRALIDAATWGEFLGIEPEPFVVDGVTYKPSMVFNFYRNRRELKERKG
jgi:hypothetical protein